MALLKSIKNFSNWMTRQNLILFIYFAVFKAASEHNMFQKLKGQKYMHRDTLKSKLG